MRSAHATLGEDAQVIKVIKGGAPVMLTVEVFH